MRSHDHRTEQLGESAVAFSFAIEVDVLGGPVSEFWDAPLAETVRNSERLAKAHTNLTDVSAWLAQYSDSAPTTSNQGAVDLPFQRWFDFKEAFSPKFVADTLGSLPYRVNVCLDAFAGSGTTAVTCRMLGVQSVGIEVNPFLADLIKAKLTPLSASKFCANYESLVSKLTVSAADKKLTQGMPITLNEPGKNGRYVFNTEVFETVRAIVRRSVSMERKEARLLRVLLGSVLVSNSNVTINGKGRRYRKNWAAHPKTRDDLLGSLDAAVDMAAADLTKFAGLPKSGHRVLRGDARSKLAKVSNADVAIFSPPYPNSFDYTDVYNLELWMLGYLSSRGDNTRLRHRTLRSHVQTKWRGALQHATSPTLNDVLSRLKNRRADLWNRNIPEMVGFYFDDLLAIFRHLARVLKKGHHAIVAIGDSQYAGIHVDVASILVEGVKHIGFRLAASGAVRSMRSSSQHGGKFELSEHCLVFERT